MLSTTEFTSSGSKLDGTKIIDSGSRSTCILVVDMVVVERVVVEIFVVDIVVVDVIVVVWALTFVDIAFVLGIFVVVVVVVVVVVCFRIVIGMVLEHGKRFFTSPLNESSKASSTGSSNWTIAEL